MEIQEAIPYIEERSKNIGRYSDALRNAIKEIDKILTPLFEESGIIYIDKQCFFSSDSEAYVLKVGRYNGTGDWGIMYIKYDRCGGTKFIGDAARHLVKAAVLRLPEFINEYAITLNERTEEYKKASEMAEAMCKAITEVENK